MIRIILIDMYKTIVARKLRRTFAAISAGDPQLMLDSLAPTFRYRFLGDNAIGGERHSLDAMRRWWDRIYRVFPNARFDVHRVLVHGAPWNTQVATELTFHADLPEGALSPTGPHTNTVVQLMTLKWGKITDILTIEDTLRCTKAFERIAAVGVADAAMAPINS